MDSKLRTAITVFIFSAVITILSTTNSNSHKSLPYITVHAQATPTPTPSSTPSIRTLNLITNDLVYDARSKLIYASVPSSAGANGNSIAFINPMTGEVGPYIFVGSEPNRLAISDDGKYLYIGLDGVAGIRRLNLDTREPDQQFSLGSDSFFGLLYPEDIEVRPGNNDEIAVSLYRQGVSPRHGGVALYKNGVRLPNKTQDHTGSNVIEFCSSTNWLYGLNNETTEFGFRRISVNSDGLKQEDVAGSFLSGFGGNFICSGGVGYSANGRAFDAASKTLLGSFNLSNGNNFSSSIAVRPDASVGRVFYLLNSSSGSTASTVQIRSFDISTFLSAGTIDVPNVTGAGGSFIRWGTDGLAFRTFSQFGSGGGGQIFLVRSNVVSGISPGAITTSSASFNSVRVAPNSIASLFGSGLSTSTATANVVPLPTQLAGVTLKIKDSAAIERTAGLFFVSPMQINFQVPAGTARGYATLIVMNGSNTVATGSLYISPVVPGIFSAAANGQGPAAAIALRVAANGTQSTIPVIRLDQSSNQYATTPIDLGVETDRVYLVLFGTGIRARSNSSSIIARIGRTDVPVAFSGPQGTLVGLDQVNLQIPRSLIGSGEVDVVLTMDGQTSNVVRVNIK